MRTRTMNRVLKKLAIILFSASLLSGCAGADMPYNILPPGPDTGGSTPPQTPPPPSSGSRCAIKLQDVKLQVHGFGGPGSPGRDAGQPDGQFSSNQSDLPDIPFRFYGREVKLIPADFPLDASFNLGLPIGIKLVDGSTPSGTFDADNNIEINNVRFEIASQQIGRIALPPLQLTTKSIVVDGRFGDASFRSDQGAPVNPADRSVKFVGGFPIPDSFGQGSPFERELQALRGGAMIVVLTGTFERMPDGAPCSDGGAGVVATEVVGEGATATETPLGENNTLFVGSVFQAEEGVDTFSETDVRFSKTKKLRIRNATTGPITGSLENRQGFVITPAGSFTIAPNETRDFTVKFNVPTAAGEIPVTRDVNTSYSFGPLAVNFKAIVKRPGPELAVVGTEENARSSVSFGNVPAKVVGRDRNTRLQCDAQTVPSYQARKLTLENRGIRPLQITKINRPVDAVEQHPDPGCSAGYGSEFIRIAPQLEGGATCQQYVANGRSYNLDRCTLPPGTGKLSLKLLYFPVNASSIANAQNGTPQMDAATFDIENNDPLYSANHGKYTLNLSAAVSPDRSDAMSLSRAAGSAGALTDSNKVIRQGGLSRINIPNATDESVTQAFYLRNNSEDVLSIRQIAVEGDDAASFEVLTTPPVPTSIPAVSPGGEPGKAPFAVRFRKGSLTHASTHLKITFRSGSSSADNFFVITLNGTVNRRPLEGRMQINAVAYNTLVSNDTAGAVNSEDYREGRNPNIRPGPITVEFRPLGGDPNSSIKEVVVLPALADRGVLPTSESLLENVKRLNPSERAQLFRFYSTRATRGPGADVRDRATNNIVCNEPTSIQGPYNPGDCGYFYYIFAQKDGKKGYYDDESGELIIPDLDLKMVVPYHDTIGSYASDKLSVMDLQGSMTTMTIDSYSINNFPGIPDPLSLVTNGVSFELPRNYPPEHGTSPLGSTTETQCPENWEPKNFETTRDLPKIGCYMTHSTRPFLHGFAFQEKEHGGYIGALVMVVEFGGENATYGNPPKPQNIPFFFLNSRMWMSFVAELQPVSAMP